MAVLAIALETIPADLIVGQQFRYIIHVVNIGPDAATNVVITDLLSDLVDPSFVGSGCTRNGRLVTCFVGTMEPGALRVVDVNATPTTVAGPIRNAASVQGANTNVATVLHLAFARRPEMFLTPPVARLPRLPVL